jgi:hypothetical protein
MIMKKAIPVTVLVLLFGAAAWYSLTKPPEAIQELPPPQSTPAQQPAEQPPLSAPASAPVYSEPEAEPEAPPEPLPELTESDAEVTQALADIAGTARLADYLVADQLISRAVASIDSLTTRRVAVSINPVRAAEDKFIVDTEDDALLLSPQNYARYDGYVALLQAMESDALIAFYRRYHPLFQQAWEENGGEGTFDDRLLAVIDNLLEAPDPAGPVYLVKPEAVYLFVDPELEAMTAGQKVLFRMGSANAAVVKEKLRAFRAALNP